MSRNTTSKRRIDKKKMEDLLAGLEVSLAEDHHIFYEKDYSILYSYGVLHILCAPKLQPTIEQTLKAVADLRVREEVPAYYYELRTNKDVPLNAQGKRTMEGLMTLLEERGLVSLKHDLQNAIAMEADNLIALCEFESKRKSKKKRDQALEHARDLYARDIAEVLDRKPNLTVEDILNFRRAPTAWAVAHVMKANRIDWDL